VLASDQPRALLSVHKQEQVECLFDEIKVFWRLRLTCVGSIGTGYRVR
jgi:hypothetical protein